MIIPIAIGSIVPMTFAQAQPASQPSMLGALLPLILIVVVMYFLMIRPQRKRQKAHQAMVDALKTGDEVVTVGGMYGSVAGIDERGQFIHLKIANEIKVKVDRSAISRVLSETQS